MNPIMSMLRSKNNNQNQNQNNPSTLPKNVSQMGFAQFVRAMKGKDVKSIIDDLRSSGQMSEAQYQSLTQQANSQVNSFKAFLK